MSASSGEINSLATVTVVDIYRRYVSPRGQRPSTTWRPRAGPRCSGASTPSRSPDGASGWRSLIVAVNRGGLALLWLSAGDVSCWRWASGGWAARPRSSGCWQGSRHLLGFPVHRDVVYLWYNVIGCVVVVRNGAGHHLPRARRHRHHSKYAAISYSARDRHPGPGSGELLFPTASHWSPRKYPRPMKTWPPTGTRRCKRTARTGAAPPRSCPRHRQ